MLKRIVDFTKSWLRKRDRRKRIHKEYNAILTLYKIGYSQDEIFELFKANNCILSEWDIDFIIRMRSL